MLPVLGVGWILPTTRVSQFTPLSGEIYPADGPKALANAPRYIRGGMHLGTARRGVRSLTPSAPASDSTAPQRYAALPSASGLW